MKKNSQSWHTVSFPQDMGPHGLGPQDMGALILRPESPRTRWGREDLEQFCAANPDLRIEMNKEGEVLIMLPVTGKGSNRNFKLTSRFGAWTETDNTGVGFDSSCGYILPNGAERSPDLSWIRRDRWDALTDEEKNQFLPLCPDFAVELRSKSDRLQPLRDKMEEYIRNGAQLGWLIDPLNQKVHIYRPDQPVEILDHPRELSGAPLLPGFILRLEGIID